VLSQILLQAVNGTSPQNSSLFQQYLTGQLWELDIIMILPFVYVAWTKFIRQGFTLSFVVEEGETVREIFGVWFIPLKYADQWYNVGRRHSKEKRTVFIDTHKVVYCDRFNKRHLIIPINNAFAYHPFADSIILPSNSKELVDKIKGSFGDRLRGRVKYDPELNADVVEHKYRTDMEYNLYPVKIDLITTIKFDAIKLFKYFFGTAMLQRTEEARRSKQQISTTLILGLVGVGVLIGIIVGLDVVPFYNSAHAVVTTTTTTSTISSTISSAISSTGPLG
jgi:hypothetical protein